MMAAGAPPAPAKSEPPFSSAPVAAEAPSGTAEAAPTPAGVAERLIRQSAAGTRALFRADEAIPVEGLFLPASVRNARREFKRAVEAGLAAPAAAVPAPETAALLGASSGMAALLNGGAGGAASGAPSSALVLAPAGAASALVPATGGAGGAGAGGAGGAGPLLLPPPVHAAKKARDLLAHLSFAKLAKSRRAHAHGRWELMRVISGHQGWVRCVDVDPASNAWFVTGGNDRLIKIWDLASGRLRLTLTGHISTVRGLAVSARHPYLFSCGEDKMVKCWDLEYNKAVRQYHGHLSGVYCLALHPELDVLATGGRDAVVRLWDVRTREAVHTLAGHTGTVMSVLAQSREPQLISGSLDKMVRCWDIRNGSSAVTLTHHKKAVRALAARGTAAEFCSAATDHVKLWRCGEPPGDPHSGEAVGVGSVTFDRNLQHAGGSVILNCVAVKTEGEGGEAGGGARSAGGAGAAAGDAAFGSGSGSGSAVAVAGTDDGHLIFWDWFSGQIFQTLESLPQPGSLSSERAIFAMKFDQSETRLITAECDKTIKVWREVEAGGEGAE